MEASEDGIWNIGIIGGVIEGAHIIIMTGEVCIEEWFGIIMFVVWGGGGKNIIICPGGEPCMDGGDMIGVGCGPGDIFGAGKQATPGESI